VTPVGSDYADRTSVGRTIKRYREAVGRRGIVKARIRIDLPDDSFVR
jgi:hypothetical protein